MQDINEKSVVLEEVISLQTAAVSDPKVRKKFAIVGCGEREAESWQSYLSTVACLWYSIVTFNI